MENVIVRDFGIINFTFSESKSFFVGVDYKSLIKVISVLNEKGKDIKFDFIRPNDILSTVEFLGIEAARNAIVNESKVVFDAYGIKINSRHLSLLADFITATGSYKTLNRQNMNYDIFKSMSFESAYKVLQESASLNLRDHFYSHNSRIAIGSEIEGGTNSFSLEYLDENY